jgi:hypothetical protein
MKRWQKMKNKMVRTILRHDVEIVWWFILVSTIVFWYLVYEGLS